VAAAAAAAAAAANGGDYTAEEKERSRIAEVVDSSGNKPDKILWEMVYKPYSGH